MTYRVERSMSSATQEQYDYLIDFINRLPLDSSDQEVLIDRIDTVITYLLTEEDL